MNLKSLFLFTSICTFGNISCSEPEPSPLKKSASCEKMTIPVQDTAGEIPVSAVAAPTASGIGTKAWYGIWRLGGKSDYEIFMELHAQGRIKADFEADPSEAMNRFNKTAAERFTKKDLLAAEKQEKIAAFLKAAHGISPELALAKGLASKYIETQKVAVVTILTRQATITEPQLKEAYDQATENARLEHQCLIQQAFQGYQINMTEASRKYDEELNKELTHAHNAASNSRYLHKRAEVDVTTFPKQLAKHYREQDTFLSLLESIREAESLQVSPASSEVIEHQKNELLSLLQEQALHREPSLRALRDTMITAAHSVYNDGMKKQLFWANKTAQQSRFLHSKKTDQASLKKFDLHAAQNFETLENYLGQLKLIQEKDAAGKSAK